MLTAFCAYMIAGINAKAQSAVKIMEIAKEGLDNFSKQLEEQSNEENKNSYCGNCYGSGKVSCTSCNFGSLPSVCSSCNGDKRVPHSSCSGTGEKSTKCFTCSGKGKVKCWNTSSNCNLCSGDGEYYCSRCKGEGVNHSKCYGCVSGTVNCATCYGTGKGNPQKCYDCNGTMRTNCPKCKK